MKVNTSSAVGRSSGRGSSKARMREDINSPHEFVLRYCFALPSRNCCQITPLFGICAPVAISNNTNPTLNISAAVPLIGLLAPLPPLPLPFDNNSGATYLESPSQPSRKSNTDRHNPKSASFNAPVVESKILSSLISR